MKTFYWIYRFGKGPEEGCHDSLSVAEERLRILCRNHPGVEFVLMGPLKAMKGEVDIHNVVITS